jgi:hypothetical protein
MNSGTAQHLIDVWGTSADNVYAVGAAETILHFDGTDWSEINAGASIYYAGIWGSSESNVIIVGSLGNILRYDGGSLNVMDSGTTKDLKGVWGSSDTDVFAVGLDGTILHFDGNVDDNWAPMNSGTALPLWGVWGTSATDVYAASNNGTVFHYDGNQDGNWSLIATGTALNLEKGCSASETDVFAVGSTGIIVHYDGDTWTQMNSGTTTYLYDTWLRSGINVLAVGFNGLILHYDGNAWSPMNSGTSDRLYGVWGTDTGHVFAVGYNGTILQNQIPVDMTPPVSTISGTPASPTNSTTAMLTVGGTDVVAYKYKLDSGSYSAETSVGTPISLSGISEGSHTVYVIGVDLAENWQLEGSATTNTWTVDLTISSGTIVINGGATHTNNGNVTIALSSSDAALMCFSNNNSVFTDWETFATEKSWTLLSEDGAQYVYVKFKDEAGNIENISDSIVLDTTPPTGTYAINDGSSYSMTADVSLNLDFEDAREMKFSNDGVSYSVWEPYATSKDWVLSAGDGIRSVYVKLKDAVGNVGTYSDTIIIDSTPPAGNMIVNNKAEYSTEKEVAISLTTDNAAYVCFSNDGTNYNGWQPYSDNTAWTLSDGDGSKSVYVKYKDEAGNTFVISQNIILDSTAPNAPVLNDLGIIDNNQPTFDWKVVSDAGHYILEYADNPDFQISELVDAIGPSEYELNSPLKDGIWYWRVFAVDVAGNESDWSITEKFTIDTTDHCYYGPEKPILQSPSNGAINVSLTPILTIQKLLETPVCNYPLKTRWRISKDPDFKGLIAKVNSESKDLTNYQISELILEPNTTYYWKVRFLGSQGNNSDWSNVFSFATQPAEGDDGDDDGIIDEQEVDDSDDLDNDGTPDNEQDIEIKSFRAKKGNLKLGMRSSNSDIICVKALHTESVGDDGNKPVQVPYGLMSYRVEVPQYGAKATIKIFLSKSAPKNAKWVFYDSLNGWLDFSEHAVFNDSRTEITVEIKDGGYGDNDHTENKIIVDPSGIGIFDSGSSGTGGGSCFISTIVSW